jgi:hypothetical protein
MVDCGNYHRIFNIYNFLSCGICVYNGRSFARAQMILANSLRSGLRTYHGLARGPKDDLNAIPVLQGFKANLSADMIHGAELCSDIVVIKPHYLKYSSDALAPLPQQVSPHAVQQGVQSFAGGPTVAPNRVRRGRDLLDSSRYFRWIGMTSIARLSTAEGAHH